MTAVHTHLTTLRQARGLGAAELARRIGVTRQAVYAIESGSYVPNTEIALKIARELDVRVEDLFALPDSNVTPETPSVPSDYLGQGAARIGQPVRACRVGERWISVPSDARPVFLPEADAVIRRGRGKAPLGLFRDPSVMGHRIVVAGCDPAAGLLSHMVEQEADVEIVHAPGSSRQALRWLRAGKVHVAGSHLADPGGEEFNLGAVGREFPKRDMAVVTFAGWEEGLVVRKGNPKSIRAIEDLARDDVTLMNREPGSGSRGLLDSALSSLGLSSKVIRGYRRVARGHLVAAYAVLAGDADCCIATRSAARAFDLRFVPLRTERYDFVLDRETLSLAPVASLLDILQRAVLRRKLEILAGYDTSETGVVRA